MIVDSIIENSKRKKRKSDTDKFPWRAWVSVGVQVCMGLSVCTSAFNQIYCTSYGCGY